MELECLRVNLNTFRDVNFCKCQIIELKYFIDNFEENISIYKGVLFYPIILLLELNEEMIIDESENFIKYEGIKTDNQYNGKSTVYFSKNIKFIGDILNGKLHGNGELFLGDKLYYRGEFKNNLFHGNGELFSNFCDHYIGNFNEGCVSGYGKVEWCNGNFYEGNFYKNIIHGHGTYKYDNYKITYIGNYSRGKRNGKGKLTLKTIDNDEIDIFSNFWFHNLIYGKGSITCKNKFYKYVGDLNSISRFRMLDIIYIYPHGNGKLLNNNNIETYIGQFKFGKKDGNGNEYDNNGTKIYSGSFIKNKYEGYGKLYELSGNILYKGNFLEGKKHGEGTTIHNYDKIEIANYKFNKKFGKSTLTDSDLKPLINYYYDKLIVSKKFKDIKNNDTDSKCPICCCDYKDNDLITELPKCGHVFHSECLFKWFETSESCPLCRKEKLFEESKKRKIEDI